jgi:hypothetical protein
MPTMTDKVNAVMRTVDAIQAAKGATYMVTIADIRDAFPGVDRADMDRTIVSASLRCMLHMDSHEGLAGPMTARVRAAGIDQGVYGLLVYAAR